MKNLTKFLVFSVIAFVVLGSFNFVKTANADSGEILMPEIGGEYLKCNNDMSKYYCGSIGYDCNSMTFECGENPNIPNGLAVDSLDLGTCIGENLHIDAGCFTAMTMVICSGTQSPPPECSPLYLNLCFTEPDCITNGGYWWTSETCNANEEFPAEVCDAMHLNLCDNEMDCNMFFGFWYNEVCNVDEEVLEICDSSHLNLCFTDPDCIINGGFWYNEVCNVDEQSGEPEIPVFTTDEPFAEIPSSSMNMLVGWVGGLFDNLSALIMLAIGLPLGFWVIGKVISLVKTKQKE